MNPPEQLEELHRQREQIAQHLEWLDSQIAHFEREASRGLPETSPLPVLPTIPDRSDPPERVNVSPESRVDEEDRPLMPAAARTIQKQRAGCIALAIAAAVAALIVFWGLPQLLY